MSAVAGGGEGALMPAIPPRSRDVGSLDPRGGVTSADGTVIRGCDNIPVTASSSVPDGGDVLARRSALVVSNGIGGLRLPRDRTFAWHPVQSLASTFAWCGT